MKRIMLIGFIFCLILITAVFVFDVRGGSDPSVYLPYVLGGNQNPPPPALPTEMVIYSWDGNVTKGDHGFPRAEPPEQNGNWVTPVNFAEGTVYIRTEIVRQPVPQEDMRLQFCFWQAKDGNNFGLETCMSQQNVPGNSGTVRCWFEPIEEMWMKDDQPLEWHRPRYRVAIPIKNGAKEPVSDYNGWNWNGENPDDWYPLSLKAVAVVVAKGEAFSGWENYGGGC